MLDATLKTQLQAYLERLRRPVEIVAALDDGESSRQMRALLQDIVPLHPMLSLVERRDADARVPSFSLGQPGEPGRVRFAGLPLGHEFTSLVLALLQVGGHPPKVEAETIERIRGIA
ncbi:MAG TPA: alkyl hydroperoxide reductase subunit F, partial [Burkholderiaceae bacterium]|nr:alkyl hydroperoxide reductase subunit F [Burkholderiaceae bacterium]